METFMRKPSTQPQNRISDYSKLVLNYLYLQSVRRNISMAKLPPDMLKEYGCTVEHNGVGVSFIRVAEPQCSNGSTERRKRDLTRIWMSKKNEDVFGYKLHKGKRPAKKEAEEEATPKSDDAEEAIMQIGLAPKDILVLKRAEPAL
jgi:hypothetical protein